MLYFVNQPAYYEHAKEWCQGLGAQLVEMWTEKEYEDVRYKIVVPVTVTVHHISHHFASAPEGKHYPFMVVVFTVSI